MATRYEFTVTLSGYGDTPDEAWQDAVEGFTQDSGVTPDPSEYITEEEEEG